MILAIGNSGSGDTASFLMVKDFLEKKGCEVILFKQDKCLEDEYLLFQTQAGSAEYCAIIDGKKYNLDDFDTIWYMHPMLPRQLLTYEPAEYRQFIDRQFFMMRQALWSLYRCKKWLNDPWAVQFAENKIYQLVVAMEAGLQIPNSIVTSNPDTVRSFYKQEGDIIVKSLASSLIMDKALGTNRVTLAHMEQIESVRMSPSIFQSLILKDYELRITIVGKEIFSVKIYSQEDPETVIDWRRKPALDDYHIRMEAVVLPYCITDKLSNFMSRLNLKFGCVDMVVTPSGEYIFLEVNPNGQWHFIQTHTGARIAEAIANLLISA